jgi:outer membrane protein assembly factor BamA
MSAQSRRGCSLAYTDTDDFKEMIGEKVFPKIVIDDVRIEGATKISGSVLHEVIETIQREEFEGGANWLQEIQESIRSPWQDEGFFEIWSSGESRLLFGDSTIEHCSVTIHLEEGLPYRLGTVPLSGNARLHPLFSSTSSNRQRRQLERLTTPCPPFP